MREIQLSYGRWAKVDDEDFWELAQYNWFSSGVYAARRLEPKRKSKISYMHREIMKPPKGLVVDHISGDTLDNQRSNLRVVTIAKNVGNRHGLQRNNTSGYRGVHKDGSRGKWLAQVMLNKKSYRLGRFDDPEDAAAVVQSFWNKHNKDYRQARY